MPAIRVLIADGQPIFVDGLSNSLEAEPDFLVVGEARDGVEAVRLVRAVQPDILLLDLAMPKLSGLEVLREVTASSPSLRSIVLTTAIERPQVIQALQWGAWGFATKSSTKEAIFEIIRAVFAGQHWLSERNVADLVQTLREMTSPAAVISRKDKFGLTPRELEVIQTVVAGYTNKEIAQIFKISEETVKHHLSHIFEKLGLGKRLELALFAIHHQLLEDRLHSFG